MLHLSNFARLFSQGGYVGTPEGATLNSPWFNHATSIAANIRSAFPAPNPVTIANNLPRPTSIVANTYGNLPPVLQAPLGSNTRI